MHIPRSSNMACNPSGRTRASSQHTTKSEENTADKSELSRPKTKIESQPEGSMMQEKSGQNQSCIRKIQMEEEPPPLVEAVKASIQSHSRSTSPPAQRRNSTRSLTTRTTFLKCQRMRVPPCMLKRGPRHSRHIENLQDQSIQPPVTLATLQELDLHSIQNNLNLRIDICHDPELFFQPISGRKGDVKRTEASRYWSALVAEFHIYNHNLQFAECPECDSISQPSSYRSCYFNPRLPSLFRNLRDIVQMLVPESDYEEVNNHLDTQLLMQQVRMGALDAIRLSTWLAKLLTSHCAPMRDRAAEAVTEDIQNGTKKPDMEIFVDGLEKLFSLLEAMKLDIANHQIRSFRYPLIEGTIEFQQDCFSKAIETKQIDITDSLQWYRRQCMNHRFECGFQEKDEATQRFACFVHGLVQLCNPYGHKLPLTLQYDHHRIVRLQEDLQDHIQMNLCLAVFNQQAQELAGRHCDPSSMYDELKQRIIWLTEDDDGNGGAISDHLDAIGVEIARAAFSMRTPGAKSKHVLNSFEFNRTIKLLHDVFRNEDRHRSVTKGFLDSLEGRVMQYAEHFEKMTTLEISNAQKHWAQARAGKDVLLAEWDEMARKLAHIGVVHWRVWRDICYWTHQESGGDNEQDSPIATQRREKDLSQEVPIWPQSVSICSKDHENDQGTAFQQGQSALPAVDAHMQRPDRGFADIAKDIKGKSGHEPDIDLDPDSDDGKRYSSDVSKQRQIERTVGK